MLQLTTATRKYSGQFISHAAAKRILGVSTVLKIWIMPNGVVGVSYRIEGRNCSTLVSRKKFLFDAIAYRTAQVNENPYIALYDLANDWHLIRFTASKNTYTVRDASCDCEDFQLQRIKGNGFSKPFCKHLLATARYEGFSTFKDYWTAKQEPQKVAA